MRERELPVANQLMTPSSGEYLARQMGETSLQRVAEQLPAEAKVLDMGAGNSDLGLLISWARSDSTVVNLDIQYANKAGQLDEFRANAPDNITWLAAGGAALPFKEATFDQIYSYNVVSHFLRYDAEQGRELGRKVLQEMLRVLKPDGEILVGPTVAHMKDKTRWGFAKLKHSQVGNTVESVLDELTAPESSSRIYRAMVSSGVGIFPRSRFEWGKKGLLLSDPVTEDYHPVFSLRGIRLGLRLAKALLKA
ncbi:MAG TPA: class I SAM-dependent methyltransferase [Patescibacteria group bacterium]|nr:class I SAM-dependent methyltransferase [Patescibacteria group bacterium]